MRKAICEYLEPDIDNKKMLWENSIFVFDTNVLLNLYRYSTKTREGLLEAISLFQDRIWMPHHVATEFMSKRCKVIYDTVITYDSLKTEAESFVKKCIESIRIKEDNPEIMELEDYLQTWVKNHREKNLLVQKPSEDNILPKLLSLYENRVGSPFDIKAKQIIYDQGKVRYEDKIPPGYKDAIKGGKNDNIYGDLIIWKEILNYSQENKKNIIFITQDKKEDWWNQCNGKTIGPRIELRKEFIDETEQEFGMYTMNSFIETYNEKSDVELDQSVIDEVSQVDADIRIFWNVQNKYLINKDSIISDNLFENILFENKIFENNTDEFITKTLKEIERYRSKIRNKLDTINVLEKKYEKIEMPSNIKNQIYNTKNNILELEKGLLKLKESYYKSINYQVS
ncbi:PIN domain-containing protein [Acetobacterium bakii]|uniref:PIN like domain-containing protein n=1 Tax=Acetobacterium bakii TaxID=52689 RepID=A0A0L6TYQ7_9FIRM|nr:PIN domain-containing protein [Acetobacterium bakii]KNZ41389.1 hypothetical protein AKG39_12270 [Acetobacterium bakii]